jgi:hypothetical protein
MIMALIHIEKSLISNVLTIDNKDILIASLLEKLCQLVDNNNYNMFKKICRYLRKIGLINDSKVY